MSIRRVRRATRQGRYEFTIHALEEVDDDALLEAELQEVILRGSLVSELTDDPRVLVSLYKVRRRTETFWWKWFAGFCHPV